MTAIGFVGLGNMGRPIATNLVAAGHDLLVHDVAGTAARAPAGAHPAASVAEIAANAGVVFLSLPEGRHVLSVCRELIEAPQRTVEIVVDLSTIGIEASEEVAAYLEGAGIGFVDSPISGGVAGARAGTLAVMSAGPPDVIGRVAPLLEPIGSNRFVVGTKAGQGQAMKLLNNYLSATSVAATSEAIRFGERLGLDMRLMLDVLNASTGRNTATESKFPQQVLTGTFDNGFTAGLMAKDVGLYRKAAEAAHAPVHVADAVASAWAAFAAKSPGADVTRMYEFVETETSAD